MSSSMGFARLDVDAEHLLRVAMLREADEAPLDRRRPRGVDDDSADVASLGLEHGGERPALGVVTDDPDADDVALESAKAESDVRRSARAIVRRRGLQHRYGRVGAQTLGRTVEVLVEHEVAHDEGLERTIAAKAMKEGRHAMPP